MAGNLRFQGGIFRHWGTTQGSPRWRTLDGQTFELEAQVLGGYPRTSHPFWGFHLETSHDTPHPFKGQVVPRSLPKWLVAMNPHLHVYPTSPMLEFPRKNRPKWFPTCPPKGPALKQSPSRLAPSAGDSDLHLGRQRGTPGGREARGEAQRGLPGRPPVCFFFPAGGAALPLLILCFLGGIRLKIRHQEPGARYSSPIRPREI